MGYQSLSRSSRRTVFDGLLLVEIVTNEIIDVILISKLSQLPFSVSFNFFLIFFWMKCWQSIKERKKSVLWAENSRLYFLLWAGRLLIEKKKISVAVGPKVVFRKLTRPASLFEHWLTIVSCQPLPMHNGSGVFVSNEQVIDNRNQRKVLEN